ncbi:TPA: hypothetical protein QHR17_004918 [Klebsiella pneumoniae subsp. pneumoniae]|nr:hypothetical protein [Klebsiella pneumoniae subsp. pneumoniae]
MSHSAARSSQQIKEEQLKEESHQHQHQHQHQQEYPEQEVRKSFNESVDLRTPHPHCPDDRRRRVSAAAGGRPWPAGKVFAREQTTAG